MEDEQRIDAGLRSVLALAPVVGSFDSFADAIEDAARAGARGYFLPDEDERVRACFSLYLTIRAGLLETIGELRPVIDAADALDEETRLRAFAVAYTAASLLVGAARFMIDSYAAQPVAWRKLDEADPVTGVPRKQFTRIYRSLTHPLNAWRLQQATAFRREHAAALDSLRSVAPYDELLAHLDAAEPSVHVAVAEYLRASFHYRLHSLRRRRMSAFQQTMFLLFEISGRVVAEMYNRSHKRVTPRIVAELAALLRPGDIIVTRHDNALSNLFLPGFWPHSALYIGPEQVKTELALRLGPGVDGRWRGPVRVLEAKKDGVRLRPLEHTLAVDNVAIVRPQISDKQLAAALQRALAHEGKLYDFEFDFTRSDKMVCTEVAYRAYHGVGPISFALTSRAGRMTLSAEDLLDYALVGQGLEPVALFGPEGKKLLVGADVGPALARSYRDRGE